MKRIITIILALVAFASGMKVMAADESYAVYNNGVLMFYHDSKRSSRTGTSYDLNTGSNNPGWYSDGNYASVTSVFFDSSFKSARPTSTYSWFTRMTNLQSIGGIDNLNTSNVTNMHGMFQGCGKLTSLDVSKFDTSKVTDMSWMFFGCYGLTDLDLSKFDTSKVTDMQHMFCACNKLTNLDVSNFDTSKVTDMQQMFASCFNLTSLDLSSFNTSGVTNMYYMFWACKSLTSLDLRNFDTSKVTNMQQMFYSCLELQSLDLSSFNTSEVTDMWGLFRECSSLIRIYVGDEWSTEKVNDYDSSSMFENCSDIIGGQGTTYDAGHTDASYAHIDGGSSDPGYFSSRREGIATSIEQTTSRQSQVTSNAWYTLDGRVVKTPLKGQLYIRGGKKVINTN